MTSILRKLQDVGEAILPSAATSPATNNGPATTNGSVDHAPGRGAGGSVRGWGRENGAVSDRAAGGSVDGSGWGDTTGASIRSDSSPSAGAGSGPSVSDSSAESGRTGSISPGAAGHTSAESASSGSTGAAAAGAGAGASASAVTGGGAVPVTGPEAGIDPDALGPGLVPPDMTLGHRRRRRGRRPTRIRSRATIRHLDIMTVIRVSLIFWTVMLIALVVASVLLWTFADAFGSLPSIEKSIRTLFSLKSFKLHPSTIAMYTAAGGLVIAIAGTIANIVLALIYNLIADVVGGVRVELETFTAE
ncbi:MAG TPA: DUF3566 domain-containing protein [Acidimicrobiales bacterium]|nr:DUF3566 domain-containing protein [Acidimicrobiales bacterium]